MHKAIVSILAASMLLATPQAEAAEPAVSVQAGIMRYTVSGASSPALMANARFTDVDLARLGSYSFQYSIYDCSVSPVLQWRAILTIINGETQTSVGSPNIGIFVLSYDVTAQKLVADFTKLQPLSCSTVVGN